jgi:hypothetical protein
MGLIDCTDLFFVLIDLFALLGCFEDLKIIDFVATVYVNQVRKGYSHE